MVNGILQDSSERYNETKDLKDLGVSKQNTQTEPSRLVLSVLTPTNYLLYIGLEKCKVLAG